uniref:Rap guanine nucleotide exchange factor (GEF) 5a n=1 Tax=Nothobranchius furzeri TaxID=105023 RepID=A0A8C6KDA1_NOTFU
MNLKSPASLFIDRPKTVVCHEDVSPIVCSSEIFLLKRCSTVKNELSCLWNIRNVGHMNHENSPAVEVKITRNESRSCSCPSASCSFNEAVPNESLLSSLISVTAASWIASKQPVSGNPLKFPSIINDVSVFAETLLDDFLLTYPVFMSTSDLCQALLGQYPSAGRHRGKDGAQEALGRKQKVLHLVSQWTSLCRDFLREDENVKVFLKALYRCVYKDLYEHPTLEKEVQELQKLYQLHRRHKTLFHQLSLKESRLRSRSPQRRAKEVLCRVYVTVDSYLSVKVSGGAAAQELLQAVAERIGVPQAELMLVAITFPGGRLLLQPQDRVFSSSLRSVGRLHVCRRDLGEVLNLFTDNSELEQRTAHLLSLNTWDVAVALTSFDWTIFTSMHEQELVYFTFTRHVCSNQNTALELLLQRCNEVQLWVMTEVLLCSTLCKRVQLIKKFIKIAAHCKAQKNLNSFFAIIMGLNAAAVSRLSQTWEKIPGKFKRLFSELETVTDPSLNHKAYRDSFKKMKAPKIPFLPLLLKDITFIHEGNRTFHDNLVNFEKLHMIADMARLIRQCQADPKSSSEVRAYVDNLHVIDNQQTLFELSHRTEPRA